MASSLSAAFCTVEEFSQTEFDYVIVGGGTAGLVLAARLTEDPTLKVGVLEAGEAKMDDPIISTPLLFTKLPGNKEYDWMMATTPQAGTKNKTHAVPRGKVLGGSSAINFMIYVRGQLTEYDDWARLGISGWNWADLKPYFHKHEGFLGHEDGSTLRPKPEFEEAYHGASGPIKTSFANWHPAIEEDWHKAVSEAVLGANWHSTLDAWDGNHLGAYTNLSTIDRSNGFGTRSYAVTGYLKPNMGRENLKILTGAYAERIILGAGQDPGSLESTGVSFLAGKERKTVRASREVLICAGTIKTPQLLELSGIGNPAVLEKAGIQCLVANNGVGENLQDHLMTCMVYDLAEDQTSLDILTDEEALKDAVQQYQTGNGGPLANSVDALCFIPVAHVATDAEMKKLRESVVNSKTEPTSQLQEMRKILVGRLEDDKAAGLQLSFLGASLDPSRMDDQAAFLAPPPKGQSRVTVGVAVCHPFSKGSVHIESNEPSRSPLIDPAYLTDPIDLETSSIGLRIADEVFRTKTLSQKIKGRVFPPEHANLSDPEVSADYIRGNAGTQYHPIGTASLGSVVDSSLRVIGVQNLRIIDASVLPMHVSGNIQSTVYAVAEKAADIIKEYQVRNTGKTEY